MGKMRPLALAACAAAIMGVGANAALAGEITGNGKPLWTSTITDPDTGEVLGHTLHGQSACAFSGQEDDQFLGGPPADNHSQSWGQIARNLQGAAGGVPGTACNPTKGETTEP
jgi:hypothetical protein